MLNLFLKLIRLLLKIFVYFVGALIFVFVLKYITCPVYTFQATKPFSGNKYYNPYHQMQPKEWRKGNFQVQSRAWAGITSGRGNSDDEIYNIYKKLDYDIIAISDYQKINRSHEDKPGFIAVYEHGYNIPKTHQVLIGSKRVLWKDYPFFQNIHNKQNIIQKLRPDNELIFLAHPKLRRGYSVEDMQYLANYDGIEVLNNYRTSTAHWDKALSAGNYVTVLGNDDSHNVENPDEIGHHCTLINAPDLSKESIIKSLRTGNAIGVKVWRPIGESMEDKIKRIRVLPVLDKAVMKGDTLIVETDSIISEVRFIGQDGSLKKTSHESHHAWYVFNANDTYIRAEIEFRNQVTFFLNPICRYDGTTPSKMANPEVDLYRTWLLRIIGFASLIFIGMNWIWLKKRFRKA
ncbi:MAG: hypothetical protein KQI35_03305 [Bacteroidetes bacterium]|nr:hypothetical protein [Bacteroidota bacterium]